MAKMKSLGSGLEGARRAVRKLFGRQVPAAGASCDYDYQNESGASTPTNAPNGSAVSPAANATAAANPPTTAPQHSITSKHASQSDSHAQPHSQLSKQNNAAPLATTQSHSSSYKHQSSGAACADPGKEHTQDYTGVASPAPANGETPLSIDDSSTNDNMVTLSYIPGQGSLAKPLETSHVTMAKENIPPASASGRENQPTNDELPSNKLASSMKQLSLNDAEANSTEEPKPEEESSWPPDEELTEEEKALRAEREKHLVFIEEALDMARLALRTNETPVGCVLVHNDKVIARGMNATNVTRNGTRHAEFMAICALLSAGPKNGPKTTSLKPRIERNPDEGLDDDASTMSPQPDEGNEDGSKGHLYPYGQKEHPDERVDRSIVKECILYVTVEPCCMCASFLRQLGIKKVFFGAVNDKFGGTGGVFSIHANSLPVRDDGPTASAHPQPPPMRLPDGRMTLGTSFPPGGGDGGNVEDGYEIEGGWGRDEAVGLLRRFYVQENGRAPVPRKKEGRAARLAATMEGKDDNGSIVSGSASVGGLPDDDDLSPSIAGTEKQGPETTSEARPESCQAEVRGEERGATGSV